MMAIDTRPPVVTADQYARIFATERAKQYPSVDALEARLGFTLDRSRLEEAARVLCCPYKAAPPNWQHGRVLYAVARRYFSLHDRSGLHCVDIGTAKGFSALCAVYAAIDGGTNPYFWSCDVINPSDRVRRNTPAEVDGLKTLAEIIEPWEPELNRVYFVQKTGVQLLQHLAALGGGQRIGFAFVDGKHSAEAVGAEWRLLAELQQQGDVAIFDDVQMPPVRLGLKGAKKAYEFEELTLEHVNRAYAIGVRR